MTINKNFLMLTTMAILPFTALNADAFTHKNIGVHTASSSALINVSTQSPSEAFIDAMGSKAISFLGDASLSKEQKKAKFKTLLQDHFDMKTIGRFALGRNWRTASAAEQQEYLNLFEKMIIDVYSSRFDEYQGEKFEVRSSQDVGKNDQLVKTVIVPNGGAEVDVHWRVRNKNGKQQIIDVIIEGVSMSMTQRSDFSSVIQRGGGKIEPLLVNLRSR